MLLKEKKKRKEQLSELLKTWPSIRTYIFAIHSRESNSSSSSSSLFISTIQTPFLCSRSNSFAISSYFKHIMSDTIHESTAGPTKPIIFLLTLGDESTQNSFQTSHARLLNELFERATVWHAKTAEKAFALFTQCAEPQAVFVADGGIARPRCEVISQRLVQYAAGGGIVVFGGTFATSMEEDVEKILQHTWDLPWELGSFHRTTLSLNDKAVDSTLKSKLPASYSQKALHIEGIQKCEAWYLPTKDSVIEEWVPCPRPITDFSESPIVFARCGTGSVGFIGDVQPEEGTMLAILAMLGVLTQ
jgi:hypothetical protein